MAEDEGEGEEDVSLEYIIKGEDKIDVQNKKKDFKIPLEEEEFDPTAFNPFDKKER